MKYILKNCNVIDGQKNCGLKEGRAIVVRDGQIEEILASKEITPEMESNAKVIDLAGKFLMPGLINMHAHLFGTGKPSKTLGGGSSQKMLINFVQTKVGSKVLESMVKTNVTQALNSGVTTVRGVGDFFYSDVIVRDKINNGKMPGPRLIVSGPAITSPGGHGDGTFAVSAPTLAGLAEKVDINKKNGVDLIKICVTGGVMDATKKGEPGVLRMSLEETKAVCERAHELGYMVASHTESPEGIKVDLLGGVDTVEHGSFLDDELIRLFKEKKASLICTISPALPLAKLSHELTQLDELCTYNSGVVFEGMIDGVKKCIANGIPVGLGTDVSCPFATPYNMWRELCHFKKYAEVTSSFAIYSATLGNAEILGIDHITGSIEQGKCADLIVTDDNPLEDLSTLRDVKMVMYRGNLIARPKVKKNKMIEEALDQL